MPKFNRPFGTILHRDLSTLDSRLSTVRVYYTVHCAVPSVGILRAGSTRTVREGDSNGGSALGEMKTAKVSWSGIAKGQRGYELVKGKKRVGSRELILAKQSRD